MIRIRQISPVVRAILVVGAVAGLTTGVTFAALNSQATLTDNDLASATVDLKVNNTDDDSSAGGSTDVGFAFTNLLPGADYGLSHNFTLKNDGSASMHVTAKASGGSLTGTLDNTKVHFKFTNTDTTETSEYTLAQLASAGQDLPGVTGSGNLASSETDTFTVQVKLDDDAITGSSASIDNFTLTFEGSSFSS